MIYKSQYQCFVNEQTNINFDLPLNVLAQLNKDAYCLQENQVLRRNFKANFNKDFLKRLVQ